MDAIIGATFVIGCIGAVYIFCKYECCNKEQSPVAANKIKTEPFTSINEEQPTIPADVKETNTRPLTTGSKEIEETTQSHIHNVTDESIEEKTNFKLHIAIDFGTAGCGLAFAYDGNVTVYNKFRAGRTRLRTTKTKTCILLNERNEVSGFGSDAQFLYERAMDAVKQEWKYFDRFKMALYESEIRHHDERKTDINETIKAMNGQEMKSETVFVAAFKQLSELAFKFLPSIVGQDGIPEKDEIQWVLTVPAIWSEQSKNKMKEWIIKAGLVNADITNQCIIAYEPDCASLAIQKEYFDNNNEGQKSFKAGEKYILVDAGGGTVDIACHQITKTGDVEEIMHPTGDAWGGCYIDDLYITLLKQIFSEDWINKFKDEEPSCYLEIISHFQDAKKKFVGETAKIPAIQLPFEFLQFLEERCVDAGNDSSPETIIEQFRKPLKSYRMLFGTEENMDETKTNDIICDIKLRTEDEQFEENCEFIELDAKIWKELFDSKINSIIKHVDKLWNIDTLKNQCNYLCLVGGFSGSKYLQLRMKQNFGIESQYNMKVIIPSSPILAVVRGAAWMGIETNYIAARRLKYTYGVSVCYTVKKAKKKGISQEFIDNNTARDGTVKHCFKIVARKNERIEFDDIKTNEFLARKSETVVEILCSDKKKPKTKDDGLSLGVITIPNTRKMEETVTEFHFYGTTFHVYAYPKNDIDGKRKREIKIDYKK